jgi:ATP-dependent DNA helicase RecG
MPSALETLVKILKLERERNYQDKAVIGGLALFAQEWSKSAHEQAKKPEHHTLVDELVSLMQSYQTQTVSARTETIQHMLGRITGRVTPLPPPKSTPPPVEKPVSPAPRPAPKSPQKTPPREAAPPPKAAPEKPERPPITRKPERLENDSHSLFGTRTLAEVDNGKAQPTSTTESDSITLEADLIEIRPPRSKQPPPRHRRDPRTLSQKQEVYRSLQKHVSTLYGVGQKTAEKLASLNIQTVQDLLFTFPRRYDDYTLMKPLHRLQVGELVTVIGAVQQTAMLKSKHGVDVFTVTLSDGTGKLSLSFFNQSFLRTRITEGMQLCLRGKVGQFLGRFTMSNPTWESVDQDALTLRQIVPIYPLTAQLTAAHLRKSTQVLVDQVIDTIPDPMPESVLDRTGLAEYAWSLRQIHRPESLDMLDHARERLLFDELILLQMGVLRNRREWQSLPAQSLLVDDGVMESFKDSLPFGLTGAQIRAIQAIRKDLATTIPMNRLLQGDVGAGKTVVAAAALHIAVAAGLQGAIMAPTGILAEQHYRGLIRLFNRLPAPPIIRLLTSATPPAERADTLRGLSDGSVNIAIGTHALIQPDIEFSQLGVVVIDEQHRFGVEQRRLLRSKGTPHMLVMTATPIPRTLALTLYADLDLTVLDELPPGRTPIQTRVISPRERERAYTFIRSQVREGRQAFIVYPLVEASESDVMADVLSAVEEHARLSSAVFPDLKIGLLHGRLTPIEKEAVMMQFSAQYTQILVCTAVVEVGIDVPNATVMFIEGAARFGLAQLHQFRGRVGRGQYESYCILMADSTEEMNNPRLQALEKTTDGYELARIDFEQRGGGELLGTRQSGGDGLTMAEHLTPRLVELAQQEARALYAEDPLLQLPEHQFLRERLIARHGDDPGTEQS